MFFPRAEQAALRPPSGAAGREGRARVPQTRGHWGPSGRGAAAVPPEQDPAWLWISLFFSPP